MFTLFAFALLHVAPATPETPYREPQLAASRNLTVLVYGAGNSIYAATSSDQGETFSKPVKIVESHIVPLTRHRGPRVVISRGALIVTAVVGHVEAQGEHTHGLPADGDLFAWRSTDGGKTWSSGVRVNDVPAAPREGLHTLAADASGNLFAAWLDNRDKGTRLYGAYSSDNGLTWSKNILLHESPDGTICQCCHPTAGFNAAGQLEVMWRNVLAGSRDFYMIRSAAFDLRKHGVVGQQISFGQPEKLGLGTWKINGCPMDGGGLAHDGAKTLTAWRRVDDVYLDEPGQPEVKLGQGKDIALAAASGHVWVAWIKGTQLQIWSNGATEDFAANAAFPNLVALPQGGVLAAWEENGGISLRKVK
jgi:hypothetical protein